MKLKDAAVIVTGGASGLGAAVVRGFRARGASVTIFDRDAERGTSLAAETGAAFCTADVTDEISVATAVSGAIAAMGRVNGLVNCAGIATGARLVGREGAHDLSLFRRTIDINLTGSFNCMWLCAAEVKGVNPDSGMTLTPWALVVQAAIAGQGVALGRAALLGDDIEKGRLVRPFRLSLKVPFAHRLVYRDGSLGQPKLRAFRDWMLQETAAQRDADGLGQGGG